MRLICRTPTGLSKGVCLPLCRIFSGYVFTKLSDKLWFILSLTSEKDGDTLMYLNKNKLVKDIP